MTALEAHNKTKQSMRKFGDALVEEIDTEISRACAKGRYALRWWDDRVSPVTMNRLAKEYKGKGFATVVSEDNHLIIEWYIPSAYNGENNE